MMVKRCLFLAGILFSGMLFAENLIYNGDFALGKNGFAIERWQRPDTNPEMIFPPLSVENDARFAGRKILKIENPYKEHCVVYSCETKLDPQKKYYLRGSIRSDGPAFPVNFSMIYRNRKKGYNFQGRTLVANGQWSAFEIPVSTRNFGGMYHLKITFSQPKNSGTLFLGGLSLSSEKDTEFRGVEMGIQPSSRVYFKDADNAECSVTIRNTTESACRKKIRLAVVDDYSGIRRTVLERELQLEPGKMETMVFALPVDRFGSFRIEPDDPAVRFFPGYYAVIGKVEALPFHPKRFSFGVNNFAHLKWERGKAPGYVASNASIREELRLLSLAGCRIIRAFSGMGIDWMLLEPEPGKFDFRYLDSTLKLYEEANIAALPVLCRSGFLVENEPWSLQIFPDWLLKGEPYARREKSSRDWRGYNREERCYIFPKRPILERYIQAVVSHAGKRVMQYEITNEPGCAISPKQYMELIFRPVSAILRRENPDATIVGVCSTGDKGHQIGEFLKKCLDLNVLENADAISFHPYGSPELGSPDPADRQIRTMKELISKYKPGVPIWNTELFYLFSGYEPGDFFGAMQVKAHHVAVRYLLELSLGVAQSTPLEGMQIWRELMIPNYQHITSWPDCYPGPVYSVYNALTRFFEGAVTLSQRKSPDGLYRCAFRRNGSLVGAVWDYQKRRNLKLDLSAFEVYDLFGNPLPSGVMTMTEAPVYLKPGTLSEKDFLKKLDSIFPVLEQTITLSSQSRLFERNGKTTLLVGLHNIGKSDESGYIGVRGEGITAVEPLPFSLKSGKYAALEIPVTISGKIFRPEIRMYSNGKIWRSATEIFRCGLVKNNPSFFFQSDDRVVSASARIEQKNSRIRIRIHVNDTTDSGRSGSRAMWWQDSVEFFLDAAPYFLPEKHASSYQPSTFRLFVMPRLSKEKQLVFWGDRSFLDPKKIDCQVSSSADGYDICLTFPEKTLKFPFGMEIKINDAEGNRNATRSFSLFRSAEIQKNRFAFTIVEDETLLREQNGLKN